MIRQKLSYLFKDPESSTSTDIPTTAGPNFASTATTDSSTTNTEELVIILPDSIKFELTDINSVTPQSGVTPSFLKSKPTSSEVYTPIQIKINYRLQNPKNGINFITNSNIDRRNWHAYTVNSTYGISTSSWVPCIDNLWERCTWSLEINIPRTVKDIGNPRIIGSKEAVKYAQSRRNTSVVVEEQEQEEEDEDDENLDLTVCSGDFNNVKETPHPIDLSKKVVSWSLFNPVCAHHVGWAVGCFSSFVLANQESAASESDEQDFEEEQDSEFKPGSTPITVYALPQDLELARNTTEVTSLALDFFIKQFGSFPFSSYSLVFVQFQPNPANGFAGLSSFSTNLLYPKNIIEPMFSTTQTLLNSIALQWSGINIVPQTVHDSWCTIGIAHFMASTYLRKLMGVNEYKYRIRQQMRDIIKQDIGKRPLAHQYYRYPIVEPDLEFVKLKAPIVLFILNKRMTKTDKSFGLSRVLPKLFLQAMSGDLPNGTITTSHFQYLCEKVNRNKLDGFFKQWVYSTGTPHLRISQKFNKKRGMIEMQIRQVQHLEKRQPRLTARSFINDATSYIEDEPSYPLLPVFTGPITIRVHEADGTPYEHIVELKEGNTKIDIQYNSKFRKPKKKDIEAGLDMVSPFTSRLGDVLTSPTDVNSWGLAEFDKRDEEMMFNDPFEWIRVDVDYEWIGLIDIRQPDYMFASQLIYDRDIEAHLESVRYFRGLDKPNTVHCTVLVRTLMDSRYFYGVRIAAAEALAKFSNSSNNFIGLSYLLRAYKEMFCFSGSTIPKSNDFGDFRQYFIQVSIPGILSKIRDENGDVPPVIKELLFNLVKFNDNTNNSFTDSIYVSKLIEALTTTAVTHGGRRDEPNTKQFAQQVNTEIDRLLKLDQYMPSYHNIIEITCIKQKIRLAVANIVDLSFEDLIYFTLDKYPSEARVEAFTGLFRLGGLRNSAILNYFLKTCLLNWERPMYRQSLITSLINSIAVAAIEGTQSGLDDREFSTTQQQAQATSKTGMIIIEEGGGSEMEKQRDVYARATIRGAIELLRRDYSIGNGLRGCLWELIHSSLVSISERRDLFSICSVLYREVDKLVVRLNVPSMDVSEFNRKIVAKNLGDGKVVLRREGRFKIQLSTRKSFQANKLKLNLKSGGVATRATPGASSETKAAAAPVSVAPVKPVIPAAVKAVVPKVQSPKKSLVKVDSTRVTFKLPKVELARFNKDVSVRRDGSVVVFKFSERNRPRLELMKGESVHRYVRITKFKKVEISSEPFKPVVKLSILPLKEEEESMESKEPLNEESVLSEEPSKEVSEETNAPPEPKELNEPPPQPEESSVVSKEANVESAKESNIESTKEPDDSPKPIHESSQPKEPGQSPKESKESPKSRSKSSSPEPTGTSSNSPFSRYIDHRNTTHTNMLPAFNISKSTPTTSTTETTTSYTPPASGSSIDVSSGVRSPLRGDDGIEAGVTSGIGSVGNEDRGKGTHLIELFDKFDLKREDQSEGEGKQDVLAGVGEVQETFEVEKEEIGGREQTSSSNVEHKQEYEKEHHPEEEHDSEEEQHEQEHKEKNNDDEQGEEEVAGEEEQEQESETVKEKCGNEQNVLEESAFGPFVETEESQQKESQSTTVPIQEKPHEHMTMQPYTPPIENGSSHNNNDNLIDLSDSETKQEEQIQPVQQTPPKQPEVIRHHSIHVDVNPSEQYQQSHRPFDFHVFLGHLRKKSADPLVRYIRSFLASYIRQGYTFSSEQRIKIIIDFEHFMNEKFTIYEPFSSMDDIDLENSREGLEKLIMNRLYDQCFPSEVIKNTPHYIPDAYTRDLILDEEFETTLEKFSWINGTHLDIDVDELGGNSADSNNVNFLEYAIIELNKINQYRAPRDKIICILNACKIIFSFLKVSNKETNADAFVPLLILVIFKAKTPNLISNIHYIENFRGEEWITRGETSYYLSSIQGAIGFIQNLAVEDLTITKEEYDAHMEAWEADTKRREHEREVQVINQPKLDIVQPQPQHIPSTPMRSNDYSQGLSPSNVILSSAEMLSKSISSFLSPTPPSQAQAQQQQSPTQAQQVSAVSQSQHMIDEFQNLPDNQEYQPPPPPENEINHQQLGEAYTTLREVFPNLDKNILKDIIYLNRGDVDVCIDACLQLVDG
ncbi:Transcription initiation factor TFIID subunit 2 [Spathaspora sp. JA1]|nr:Transcription initiation factor TFIID subunit 2 [Spathaspora sp. JA1]